MIKTYGLTHVAAAVRDVGRASKFYRQVFGAVEVYRQKHFVQLQTPGSRDVLVFEENAKKAGRTGGIAHFGFRLQDPQDIELAVHWALSRPDIFVISVGDVHLLPHVLGAAERFERSPADAELEAIGAQYRAVGLRVGTFHLPFTAIDDMAAFYETARRLASWPLSLLPAPPSHAASTPTTSGIRSG